MGNKLFRCEVHAKHGDIYMYGDIGGGWFGGVTAEEVIADINAMGDVETITVHVNSPGGDVFDGIAIRSTLMKQDAEINIEIDALAASAATVAISIPDVDITMAEGARYMIHNPWGIAIGESGDMRKTASLLDAVRDDLVTIYETRSNLSADEIVTMMDDETWMGAEAAVDHGFVTSTQGELAIAACLGSEKLQERFKHIPDDLRQAPTTVIMPPIAVDASTTEDDTEDKEPLHLRSLAARVAVARADAGLDTQEDSD